MSSHAHNTNACYAENLTQRTDPTHTYEIRQNFLREIRKRFKILRGLIRRTVGYENDAFGLTQNQEDAPEAYDFPTDKGKIDAFIRDVKAWIQEHILEPANFTEKREGEHYSHEFIRSGFVQGHRQAVGVLKQQGVSAKVLEQQELLNRPVRVKTLKDLYIRTYENLQDITEEMADSIRNELVTGFAQGENPRKIADRLTNEVRDIQHTRAETLARTEVINAHSDAAIQEYEQAGAEVVNHTSRLTAQDARVCPFCRALEGVPFTLQEFQTVTVQWGSQTMRVGIPAHANGRCAPVPEMGLSADELDPLQERIPDTIRGKPVTILTE